MEAGKAGRAWAVALLLLSGCDSGSGDSGPEFRTITGELNHVDDPTMGMADTALSREAPAAFADGLSMPAGPDRPNPRTISNVVCAQPGSIPNSRGTSDFLWQWGQFLDHDLDLSPEAKPQEPLPIRIPTGDPHFDPGVTNEQFIPFFRSGFDPLTGVDSPREQMNAISAYIDASNVYGSDPARAAALRTHDGTGRLRTSAGGLLPFNVGALPNAPTADDPSLFLAGDARANEQVALTAMHTLFMREHNRWAERIQAREPGLSDDEIYQRARAVVGAEIQVITYREFLPLLLGPNALEPYAGFNPGVDTRVMNEFSTVAFRLGHSLLSTTLRRLDASGNTIPEGDLSLRDAFFSPQRLVQEGGIEPILRGLASQPAQEIDPFIVDDVRNFLFGPPGSGGMDLASLNIQRGRDHGLPSYNDMRLAFGLEPKVTFEDISTNPDIAGRLRQAYVDPALIDPWVGGLAEDHVPGAMVGELFFTVLKHQFERLRDGDRYWYANPFATMLSPADVVEVSNTTLAKVIRSNTPIGSEIQDNVFLVSN